jgi:DNA-binding CsgD family transcriptional regulator
MKTSLSTREHAVLNLAVQGYTDEMIARALDIKVGTVNTYWVRLRGKLGHLSRTELVARFVQKAADERLADAIDQAAIHQDGELARTDGAAQTQKDLLDAANSEIERLKSLLADRGR